MKNKVVNRAKAQETDASVNIKELTNAYVKTVKRGDVSMGYAWHRISELEKEFRVLMWDENEVHNIDDIKIDGTTVYYMHHGKEIVERDIRDIALTEIMEAPGFNWVGRKSNETI